VFFSNKMPAKKVRGAAPLRLDCGNCKNTADHELWWIVPGKYVKYMGQVVVGTKHYVYICPVCKNVGKEVSKEQAAALKAGA
jgi:hypothetical protein